MVTDLQCYTAYNLFYAQLLVKDGKYYSRYLMGGQWKPWKEIFPIFNKD